MIAPEQIAEIRRLFFAEHWKVGTIVTALGLHPDTVRGAIGTDRFNRPRLVRASALTDPYFGFIRQTLDQYPDLRATRIYQMLHARGYLGSVVQLRRVVARLRPLAHREAFLALRTFAGEEAQADWAHFGEVCVGRAKRRLSCFVLTLSYSRALALEFFFDQSLENFLRGHVRAFQELGGVARTILYDNLRSVVLERRRDAIHFHPRLLELCAHYHFQARPCRPARGSEKGRVERAIRYVRESFFAARSFTTLADFNCQARTWRDEIAHRRPWPGDDRRTVADAFEEEKARLLPLPAHPFDTDLLRSVRSEKTIYVRFDLNDYSIPPTAVGRPLTLAASDTEVRLLDGVQEIARHRRIYDRHERIEDPAHQMALLEDKRKATGSTRNSRLAGAVPEIEALLDTAFARGEPAGAQTTQLLLLLDDYGAVELRAAVQEALERGTPRASSVAYILSRRHRTRGGRAALPVNLTRRPDLADVHVEPHNPETYDELTRDDDPDE
jgi:transposase